MIIKCLRPDRLVQGAWPFINAVFDKDVSAESDYDLGGLVAKELDPSTPLALVSVVGYDASYTVENLVKNIGSKCTAVAMGS